MLWRSINGNFFLLLNIAQISNRLSPSPSSQASFQILTRGQVRFSKTSGITEQTFWVLYFTYTTPVQLGLVCKASQKLFLARIVESQGPVVVIVALRINPPVKKCAIWHIKWCQGTGLEPLILIFKAHPSNTVYQVPHPPFLFKAFTSRFRGRSTGIWILFVPLIPI